MAWGLGLGKSRTRLGYFLDQNGITQGWLERKSGISESTITRLCNNRDYCPTEKTAIRIVGVLRREGYRVGIDDFW